MKIGNESSVERGGGLLKKILAASALTAALTLPTLIAPASAVDTVRDGRTIEAFIGGNLVNVQGYPANKRVTIQVLRNGVLVSSVVGKTDADGFAEFNHIGGGQVSAGGDCFRPPVSPDIMPGDTIRTKTAGDTGGFDSAVVRDLGINFDSIAVDVVTPETEPSTITVSGRVASTENAPITPGTDILELRLNKATRDNTWETGDNLDQDRPNRRDLRVDIGEDLTGDGDGDPTTFTRVLRVSNDDAQDWQNNPGEVGLEWSVGAGAGAEEAAPPAIFVADEAEGPGALPGCPPLAENAITTSGPKVINKANVDRGIRLAGISKDASAVSVTLDDSNASTDPVELTATPQAAQVAGFQTWRTAKMDAGQLRLLRLLKDGRLNATATYTVGGAEVQGRNIRILKDTVAPRTPTATPKPGVFPRTQRVTLSAQPGTTIRYTLNGKRPTATSRVYKRQIRVPKTRTIKAIAIDRAGNKSTIGAFRYVIRR